SRSKRQLNWRSGTLVESTIDCGFGTLVEAAAKYDASVASHPGGGQLMPQLAKHRDREELEQLVDDYVRGGGQIHIRARHVQPDPDRWRCLWAFQGWRPAAPCGGSRSQSEDDRYRRKKCP